jgi:hypothetical protein
MGARRVWGVKGSGFRVQGLGPRSKVGSVSDGLVTGGLIDWCRPAMGILAP